VVVALVLVPASRAWAQEAEPIVVQAAPVPDTVTLNDGSTVAGRIVEVRLFEQVVITRSDGATVTIPWSHVRGFSADRFTMSAPNVQPPPGTPPILIAAEPNPTLPTVAVPVPVPVAALPLGYDPRVPGPGRVPLRIHAADPNVPVGVAQPRFNGRGLAREPLAILCNAPCTLYVRPGEFPLWYADPDGRPHAQPVQVVGPWSTAMITPRNPNQRMGGVALTVLGGIGLLAGAFALEIDALSFSHSGTADVLAVVGMLAGGGAVAGGITLIRTARAHVEFSGGVLRW
jgi:hypothetical protein